MKRTPEQCKSFFQRNTDNRGFGRELYQTPFPIIEKIVSSIIEQRPSLKNKKWVDPCAGDGRWQEIAEKYGIDCESYDLEPLSNNVKQQNFLTSQFNENNLFFIGNPPFSLLKQFINKSLEIADSCYFLGGSQIITGTLSNRVDLLHRFEGCEGNQKDKRSKIGFTDTFGNDVYVWCCGAIFDKNEHPYFIRNDAYIETWFRTSIKSFCKEDERVIKLNVK